MDKTDKKILDLLKGNARMTYQELGDELGMSRVAAQKRVKKLEDAGIIRGYNTTIYQDDEVTMFMDIVTKADSFDRVLEYLGTRTVYIRQIFTTTQKYHIHVVAVSDSIRDLKYLQKVIQRDYGDGIKKMTAHAVTGIVKDVYGGVRYDEYKRGKVSEDK